ncbi:serine/threonine-protein kinase VRK1-like isoform X2 [Daphnia pulicaria]|uniref:serine/threonine-protein kinase VRK1-like isoform X2 n=1 Tax=Daphnia pulicaria TaxID=35523 RepID=UPI001EEAE09F|nr:serine/threonine-protein kinase VRK1-like isoform X2 [Daphnia pulicaria]
MPPKAAASRPAAAKKKAPIHKLPDPIRDGEIVRDIQKRQWRLGKSIGVGGFGEIYAASDNIDKQVNAADAQYVIKIEPHSNGPLFVEMNFYIRVAKADFINEWITSNKLKFLGMPRFIGSGSHEYKGEKYRFMVMQRFGIDVQKLFDANQRRFPLNTILNLSLRIIDVLEYIHAKQYVHADIKGSNLLLGFGKGGEKQVWLVDFGLACRYTVDGVHKEYKPDLRKAHNGTIEFTSRDAHIGANGRRGDFEILGYNMLQWMCGRLPWESNLTDPEFVASQKNKYMSNIPALIQECFPAKNAPAVMVKFLEMVANLKFEEKPNYDKFRQLLRQGLKDGGFPDDGALVFPHLNKGAGSSSVRSSPKKRSAPPPVPTDDETENGNVKQKAKTSIKKSREPCSPKVTNRTTRRANMSPDCDTTDSSSLSSTTLAVVSKKRSAEKKERSKELSAKLDTSLSNPTPAMLAILARMRSKEETPSPALPSKRKQARLDSRSCSPIDLDSSSILTPAMEEVIRVREVRKSMEQSGHFFTPICSPKTTADPTPINRFQSPTLTPRNMDLYMTMDCTPEEEEPRRKKSNGSGKGFVTPSSPSKRVLRNRLHESVILDDSTSSSVNSSTAGESSSSTTPDNQRRVVHRHKYRVVDMASASTQTSPGVLSLPTLERRPYSLRSAAQSPASTPGRLFRPPPQIIDLSPDMFRNDASP